MERAAGRGRALGCPPVRAPPCSAAHEKLFRAGRHAVAQAISPPSSDDVWSLQAQNKRRSAARARLSAGVDVLSLFSSLLRQDEVA
eukprot:5461097-Prymnesium_polylepis.2